MLGAVCGLLLYLLVMLAGFAVLPVKRDGHDSIQIFCTHQCFRRITGIIDH